MRKVDLPMRAAGVSYFLMLAAIPLVGILLTLIAVLSPEIPLIHGSVVPTATANEAYTYLHLIMPGDASHIVLDEMARIQKEPQLGLLSVAFLAASWTGSNAFMAIIDAMNKIYGVAESRSILATRLRAILLPVLLCVIFILALSSIIVLPILIKLLMLDSITVVVMATAQWLLMFAVIAISFGVCYHFAPDKRKPEPILNIGAAVAALIFLVASVGFQAYVMHFNSYQKTYGSLGGAIVLLVWIWLASYCLLLGCAINKTIAEEKAEKDQANRTTKSVARVS